MSTQPISANQPKPKNPYRVSVRRMASDAGYDELTEYLEDQASDSVVDACCSEGCQVEPDGRCEHGCPSVLMAMGIV